MTRPKVQNLWNDLNESYTLNSTIQHISCTFYKGSGQIPKYQFLFWITYETQNFSSRLVEDSIIWEQWKNDSLSRDKQHDLVFFLMYTCFLICKVFLQNGRCRSDNTPVLDLDIWVASNCSFFGEYNWFVISQQFLEHKMCSYCMVMHVFSFSSFPIFTTVQKNRSLLKRETLLLNQDST